MNTLKKLSVPKSGDSLEKVIDYLTKQNEALCVMLTNLGADNLSPELKAKIYKGGE